MTLPVPFSPSTLESGKQAIALRREWTSVFTCRSKRKLRQKAEANLHVSGADVFADSVEEDMYAAIDGLVDKIDRQVKKHKEKMTDHHRGEVSLKTHEL